MHRYVDQSNYVVVPGVMLDQEDMVERDGYRNTEEMVSAFLDAGERLADFRRMEYDNEIDDLSEESLSDPTRTVGFDIIDAAALAHSESARLKKLKADKLGALKKAKEDKDAAAAAAGRPAAAEEAAGEKK